MDLLRENISAKADSSKGFLIDGYPREMDQGVKFEEQVGTGSQWLISSLINVYMYMAKIIPFLVLVI